MSKKNTAALAFEEALNEVQENGGRLPNFYEVVVVTMVGILLTTYKERTGRFGLELESFLYEDKMELTDDFAQFIKDLPQPLSPRWDEERGWLFTESES